MAFVTHRSSALLAVLALGACAASPLTAAQEATPAYPAGVAAGAEAICSSATHHFVSDGDGTFVHYVASADSFSEVRRIATNPDVESCVVVGGVVYFVDPQFGVLSFAAHPEAEPIVRPVYLQPPFGSGSIEPLVVSSNEAGQLLVTGKTGDNEILAVPDTRTSTRAVAASAETAPVSLHGDAADDPVVITTGDTALIVGADKKWGLRVYDLDGNEIQGIPLGRINNVDAVVMGDTKVLIAGSNRSNRSISLIEVAIDGNTATFEHIKDVSLDLDDPYGLCAAKIDDTPTVFVGDKEGNVQRWTVDRNLSATMTQTIRFDSQTEGCVVDTAANVLFVGEEEVGIWALDLLTGDRQLFAAVDGESLVADVEGLDLYEARGEKHLIASSQGDNTYVRYPLSSPGKPVKFGIGPNWQDGIDGASETDGLAVYSQPLPGYPAGILVVQDGHNVLPAENQNFKIVDLRTIDD